MASPTRKQFGIYGFWTGLALACLFGILASVDESNRPGYIGAMILCIFAGLVGLFYARSATR
jgi:hypothetical protein